MKKFEFVPRREYSSYLHHSTKLVEKITSELSKLNIKSVFYPVGSGKYHLITRCIENGKKHPFDLDYNLEIDIKTLPEKFRNLNLLKETVKTQLNNVIRNEKESFRAGQDSTSVITVPLHFPNDVDKIEFSIDVAIVSKNENGDLQRLVRNKKTGGITWSQIKNTNNIKNKIQEIKTANLWNDVRKNYLNLKNNPKIEEPSFICRIMAIENVYKNIINSTKVADESFLDVNQMFEKIKKADTDTKNTIRFKNLVKEVGNESKKNQKLGIKNFREKAITDVYNRSLNYGSPLYESFKNPYFDPVGDSAEDY